MHLIHRLREPNAAIEHPPLLVLLHGIGSNEQDLYSLAPLLDERLVVVSARAPLTLAPGMYSWFTIEIGGNGLKINYAELERSRDAVIEFVRQAAGSHDVDPRKIFLMGFSQGAMLSAAVAFAEPSMFAGAVLMSGAILPESTGKAAILGRLVGFPLMATHG
ncbi:MAG: phospholipase/Carboxylesterase, partial [Chloroflexi bacterium]|nr:phospholipase/Carboxylesterase [Chloroflexota bacterium]